MTLRTDKDIEFWKEALKNATEHYEACRIKIDSLDTERAEIAAEMQRLQQLIHHIEPFTSEHHYDALEKFLTEFVPDPDAGLANATRQVLYQTQRYMTPIEIRNVLDASKYDLTQHSNALASIHGILKRFEQSGEVSMVQSGSKAAYKIHPADRGVTGTVKVAVPRWRKVPTMEEAVESERRRAEARAAMDKAKKLRVPEEPKKKD